VAAIYYLLKSYAGFVCYHGKGSKGFYVRNTLRRENKAAGLAWD
jgi:hypothetical protein